MACCDNGEGVQIGLARIYENRQLMESGQKRSGRTPTGRNARCLDWPLDQVAPECCSCSCFNSWTIWLWMWEGTSA